MNTEKYKSIVVDKDTYEYIKGLAYDDDRAITKTLRNYFFKGVEAECDECNLDSVLKKGGTPRLHRLLEDLRWYQNNSDTRLKKYWIIDDKEKEAISIVIDALADSIE